MKNTAPRSRSVLGCALCGLLLPAICHADVTVHQGWSLFETQPGTHIDGISLTGVPLGTFDFGSGAVNVGATDTIIERIADASVAGPLPPPETASVGLQLDALQLESSSTLIFPGDSISVPTHYFLTLQSARGGPASTGSASITFDQQGQGNFSSSLDVFFDIRRGSLSGPIVSSQDLVFSNNGKAWKSVDNSSAALLLPGIDFMLNGADTSEDFWVNGELVVHDPGSANLALAATVPEPGEAAAAVAVILCGAAAFRHRRAAKALLC